jgi:hypothetical protein
VSSSRLALPGLAMLAALAISTGAAAASSDHPKYLAPPGNPAVTQYLEVVPNAMGSAPPRSGGNPPPSRSGGGGGGQPGSLSPAEHKKLDQLGPDGKTLSNVVQETAPPTTQSAPATSRSGSSSSGSTSSSAGADPVKAHRTHSDSLSSTGSGSAASAVLGAATGQGGGGGMGILLPALMAAGLLSVAFAVLRRRGVRRP